MATVWEGLGICEKKNNLLTLKWNDRNQKKNELLEQEGINIFFSTFDMNSNNISAFHPRKQLSSALKYLAKCH